MGFPTPFPAKYGLRIIIRKTYFYQKMGLYLLKIVINNTEKTARTCRFQRWHSRLHISHPGGVYGQNTFYEKS